MLWVRISIRSRCTILCDKVCQWLATGQWFSPRPPVSSTNKTDHHDINEILLKVALNTIKPTKQTIEQNREIPVWLKIKNWRCKHRGHNISKGGKGERGESHPDSQIIEIWNYFSSKKIVVARSNREMS